jgi:hypothetical protein
MTDDSRKIPPISLDPRARSLLDGTLAQLRRKVITLATGKAVQEDSDVVSDSHVRGALLELGLISEAVLSRREATQRKFRRLSIVASGLAVSVAAFVGIYAVSRFGGTNLDQADRLASIVGALLAAGGVLVSIFSVLQSRQAAAEVAQASILANERLSATEFVVLWGELERQIRAAIGERLGESRSTRPFGIVIKDYARVAKLEPEEFRSLLRALELRNRLAHGQLDELTSDDLNQASTVINENIKRAKTINH